MGSDNTYQERPKTMTALLKISPSNAKIGYESLSLLSGYSCPFALDCLAKVDLETYKIIDGPDALFRCFSATAEAAFPSVRRQRQHNFDLLKATMITTNTIETFAPGKRVQLHPALDRWMMGDRYGDIVKITHDYRN
jgi:hypothetical protein